MSSRPRSSFLAVLMVLLWPLLTAGPAAAADPVEIAQFRHTTWSSAEVPGAIVDIATGADGLLWMATSQGLVRFDGEGFLAYAAPETSEFTRSLANILITRKGEVWVGRHGQGGVATFRNGVFTDRHVPNPERQITELEEGADGSVWTVIARPTEPLAQWTNGVWRTYGVAQGLPEGWVFDLKVDGRGLVWVATDHHVAVLRPGAARFEIVLSDVAGGPGLARDAAGRIWLGDQNGVRRLADPARRVETEQTRRFDAPSGRRVRLAFARDGALWGAVDGDGAFRLDVDTGDVSRFTQADGLAGDDAKSLLVDREGVVWIGGQFGLDAFVETLIVADARIPRARSGSRMAGDGRGGAYVLNDDRVYRLAPGQPPALLRVGLGGTGTLCEAVEGVLLFHDQVVERIVNNRTIERFELSEPVDACCCIEEADGSLWAINANRVLIRDGRKWRVADPSTVGARPRGLFRDRAGHALIADWGGALFRPFDGQRWRSDQLRVGAVIAVHDGRTGLLASGLDGLVRLTPSGVQRLSARRHPWLTNVRAIAQGSSGDIWLFGDSQVVRVSPQALTQAFAHPEQSIPHTLFDRYDGLLMALSRSIGTKVVAASDGQLWVLGQRGVMRVRPDLLHQPSRPPPVQIESLSVPGLIRAPGPSLVFGPGVDRLQITYVAGSLRTLGRVRYRYRLEGVDKAWVDAGVRRFAVYGRLPPGAYRFQVIASNDAGVWNTEGAKVAFRVRPHFWETYAFAALCILAGLLMLWILYRMRLSAAGVRIQMVMEERLRERERIARDLHDTLLQGVQALILKFQIISNDLPKASRVRSDIEDALDRGDEVLREARDRVLDLRVAGGNLASRLRRALAQAHRRHPGPQTTLSLMGDTDRLTAPVADEILGVALEAVSNAMTHSQAQSVGVTLTLSVWNCVLVVQDDGGGIPSAILAAGERADHFGLAGMRERAARLGGRLEVASGAWGTRVKLTVPGRSAFGSGWVDRLFAWLKRSRSYG